MLWYRFIKCIIILILIVLLMFIVGYIDFVVNCGFAVRFLSQAFYMVYADIGVWGMVL